MKPKSVYKVYLQDAKLVDIFAVRVGKGWGGGTSCCPRVSSRKFAGRLDKTSTECEDDLK